MVAQSQDPSRIKNYRNEHKVSSNNPEQLVPLETITIEVVSDTPLPPPMAPLIGATGGVVSVSKLATQRGREVDTDYASTEFEVTNDSSDSSKAASRAIEAVSDRPLAPLITPKAFKRRVVQSEATLAT